MSSEKEQLVGFAIFIMREYGLDKYLPENSHQEWLKYPISGVRQAANDMVESCQDIKNEELERLDTKLSELNLLTLTSMRLDGFDKFLKVVSNYKIKNDEEWYLLRSFMENNSIDKKLLSKSQKLLDDFEFNKS